MSKEVLSFKELVSLMENNNNKILDNERKMKQNMLNITLLKKAKSNWKRDYEIQDAISELVDTYSEDMVQETLLDNWIVSAENKVFNAKERIKFLENSNKLASEEFSRIQSNLDDFNKKDD